MSLKTRVDKIFMRAWKRYGRPQMGAVPPVTSWTLPAGFAYDDNIDAIANSAHTVILNPEDYWGPIDYIYIVPVPPSRTADFDAMLAAGVIPTGITREYILAIDVPTVRAAHAVEINGEWYTVMEVGMGPSGYDPRGIWSVVTLQRRS